MFYFFISGLNKMPLPPPLAQKYCVLDSCLKHNCTVKLNNPETLSQAHCWGGIDRLIRDGPAPTDTHYS